MRYKEYIAKVDDLEKKLGVLGEVHIYTPDNTNFAREIVSNFDTVAMESSSRVGCIGCIGALYVPFILAYSAGTTRSFMSETAITLAKNYGKRVVRLEEDIEQHFPLSQKIALVAAGLITIPLAPLIYVYCKLKGDIFEEGSEAHKELMVENTTSQNASEGLFGQFFMYAYADNAEDRNIIMAERSAEILRGDNGNLLVVIGDTHFDEINQNLQGLLRLEETRSVP